MAENEKIQESLRQVGRPLLMLLVAVLVVHDIFGEHGFLAMRRTEKEIVTVRQNINRLNQENLKLADEVKALKSDPQLIEKIARDELGLARPGEVMAFLQQSDLRLERLQTTPGLGCNEFLFVHQAGNGPQPR